MKNIFKFVYLLFALFAISSCEDGTENSMYDGDATSFFLDKFAVAKGPDVGYKDFDIKIGTMSPLNSAADFEIKRIGGDAVAGTHYEILNGGKVQIAAGSNLGIVKLRVYGAQLSQTIAKTLVFDLVSPSVKKANYNTTISLSLIFGCDSSLEGTYQYSTVNAFAPDAPTNVPGPVTGNVTFTKVSDGLYQISDSSFGAFALFPGYAATSTGVRIEDLCGKLSFKTPNQYGDTFVISNVVVNGNKLTFKWTTSYGEYGTTTLTKSDGNWPALN
ncbi:hypothetical protein LNP04_13045 [Chryseobacterium sp. C-71]|uniref:hypothetical protein n=1 Tax=Chryseobacterium sp. C-71 TaxID=2893882 RepID=UPI001E53CBAC|nr:hypothetical protein [Chryseobacterium sp. C-71]UFH30901.1 hypothetical protein LNP04_13045 [Chryseobacterium sp. C-71]